MKMTPEQLFEAYQPDLGDKDGFLDELDRKLDAVETIHKACEENARSARIRILAAALTGTLTGAAVTAAILFTPLSVLEFSLGFGFGIVTIPVRNIILLLVILSAVPISLVIASKETR